MKIITVLNYIVKLVLIVTISFFDSCKSNSESTATKPPVLSDYTIGEKWVWKYIGVTDEGEVRSDGTDTRKIVNFNGVLGMIIDKDTVLVSEIVKPGKSDTPKYKWPLEVGKKWKYEKNWTSQDGTTGKQTQDVEVLSYKQEKVGA